MHIPDGGEPKSRRGRGVTMQDVGRMAGVSQVTVSRALSDPAKVSPDTLRRITQAIEATGFVPNALAGALASRRSGLVTALVPSITNIIYASMVQAFGLRMRDAGYQILLSETGLTLEAEEETLARHLSRRPDAVLLTGIHHTARTRRMLLASGIPVVEVWDFTETPIDACVGFDHAATGRAVGDLAAASRDVDVAPERRDAEMGRDPLDLEAVPGTRVAVDRQRFAHPCPRRSSGADLGRARAIRQRRRPRIGGPDRGGRPPTP